MFHILYFFFLSKIVLFIFINLIKIDGKIYIWNKNSRDPCKILDGHNLSCNSLSWHPTICDILVSASDDYSVRIWGSYEFKNVENSSKFIKKKNFYNCINLIYKNSGRGERKWIF